jgi:phospholipid/cholesterol/gamma-HCH transport system substrate-binding protein
MSMKTREKKHNIILGLFVLIGLALFLIAVFFVGNNETLFQRSFLLFAEFRDAGGLQKGDNVWLTGVKVGTISDVDIIDDSTVHVSVRIKRKYRLFVKEDVVASIGRDGLMGNRILVLKNQGSVKPVVEYQSIAANSRDETTELMELLKQSGKSIQSITRRVESIAGDIEGSKGILGELINNEKWSRGIANTVAQLEITSRNTASVTGDLSVITEALKENKSGLIATLVTDTTFSTIYGSSLANIEMTSDNAATITSDFKVLSDKLKLPKNSIALVLTDTAFARNLKTSAQLLNEDLEAAQHSFLLKGYFKKKKKNEKKAAAR